MCACEILMRIRNSPKLFSMYFVCLGGGVFANLAEAYSFLLQNKTLKVAERFTRYFIANSMKQSEAPFLEAALSRKAVILEYARAKRPKAKRKSKEGKGKAEVLEYAREKRPTAKRKSKALSAGEKRRLKVFDIKPEHQRLVQ